MDAWWAANGGSLKDIAMKPNHTSAENNNICPWSIGRTDTTIDPAAVNAAGVQVSGSNDTVGVTFALSQSELNVYRSNLNLIAMSSADRPGNPTKLEWGLRTPGYSSGNYYVTVIGITGAIFGNQGTNHTVYLRPALWVQT